MTQSPPSLDEEMCPQITSRQRCASRFRNRCYLLWAESWWGLMHIDLSCSVEYVYGVDYVRVSGITMCITSLPYLPLSHTVPARPIPARSIPSCHLPTQNTIASHHAVPPPSSGFQSAPPHGTPFLALAVRPTRSRSRHLRRYRRRQPSLSVVL